MRTPSATARSLRSPRSATVLAIALLATACSRPASNPPPAAPTSEEAMMTKGLEQLDRSNDAAGAVATFREVLSKNPTHYGAHYQLARALDRAGRPVEARPIWEEMLRLADAIKDTATTATIHIRLAQPDTVSQDAMMRVGLDLIYSREHADPAAAAEQFRAVLARNPTHYGAHFQLARALDLSGKPAEARQIWTKVLSMATAIKDQTTADTARARLARKP